MFVSFINILKLATPSHSIYKHTDQSLNKVENNLGDYLDGTYNQNLKVF